MFDGYVKDVLAEHDEVGEFAHFDAAGAIFLAHEVGGVDGVGANGAIEIGQALFAAHQ